jgi:GH24 family phage-related lysozyme (muramidase)
MSGQLHNPRLYNAKQGRDQWLGNKASINGSKPTLATLNTAANTLSGAATFALSNSKVTSATPSVKQTPSLPPKLPPFALQHTVGSDFTPSVTPINVPKLHVPVTAGKVVEHPTFRPGSYRFMDEYTELFGLDKPVMSEQHTTEVTPNNVVAPDVIEQSTATPIAVDSHPYFDKQPAERPVQPPTNVPSANVTPPKTAPVAPSTTPSKPSTKPSTPPSRPNKSFAGNTPEIDNLQGDNLQAFYESIDAIKHFEGFRTKPYVDSNGYAIGYGFTKMPTGSPVAVNDTMTKTEADAYIIKLIYPMYLRIAKQFPQLNVPQTMSLVDLDYNAGAISNPRKAPKLHKALANNNLAEAAFEMLDITNQGLGNLPKRRAHFSAQLKSGTTTKLKYESGGVHPDKPRSSSTGYNWTVGLLSTLPTALGETAVSAAPYTSYAAPFVYAGGLLLAAAGNYTGAYLYDNATPTQRQNTWGVNKFYQPQSYTEAGILTGTAGAAGAIGYKTAGKAMKYGSQRLVTKATATATDKAGKVDESILTKQLVNIPYAKHTANMPWAGTYKSVVDKPLKVAIPLAEKKGGAIRQLRRSNRYAYKATTTGGKVLTPLGTAVSLVGPGLVRYIGTYYNNSAEMPHASHLQTATE